MLKKHRMSSPRSVIPADLADRVRAERIRRRWSQDRLAKKVRVTRWTILRLEQGKHRPTSGLVHALERALELTALVPRWPEAADPDLPSYGPRIRRARVAAGLRIIDVAAAASVSPATLSRFEREQGESAALVGRWDTADEGITSLPLAVMLGFASCEEVNEYCLASSSDPWIRRIEADAAAGRGDERQQAAS